ncbi:Hypothetical protein SMAX5B_010183 [Scophthalmus maximus]|uniref:Uncharacterized protein n=1 Tax=Scophthalmus maximus TaxID=52904 RepID=A0A2U9B5N8_SCOMX|nr:Hypothetical protein SMAX5B_010183 [Scophthalmus maximus]
MAAKETAMPGHNLVKETESCGGRVGFAPWVLMEEEVGEGGLSMVITRRWTGCYGVPLLHSDSYKSALSCAEEERGRGDVEHADHNRHGLKQFDSLCT